MLAEAAMPVRSTSLTDRDAGHCGHLLQVSLRPRQLHFLVSTPACHAALSVHSCPCTTCSPPPPAEQPYQRMLNVLHLLLSLLTTSPHSGLLLALLDSHLDLTQQLAAAVAEQQLLQAAAATCLDAAAQFKDSLVQLMEDRHPGCTTQEGGGSSRGGFGIASGAGGGLGTPNKRSRLDGSLLGASQQQLHSSMAAAPGQLLPASPGPLLGSQQGTPGKVDVRAFFRGDNKQGRMSMAEDRAMKLLRRMPPDLSVLCDRDTLIRAAATRQREQGGRRAASGGLAEAAADTAAAAAAAAAEAAATQAADLEDVAPAADAGAEQVAAAEEDEADAADVAQLVAAVGQAARAPSRHKAAGGRGLLSVLGGAHRAGRKRG